jgi:hypothetical protein
MPLRQILTQQAVAEGYVAVAKIARGWWHLPLFAQRCKRRPRKYAMRSITRSI